jgi:hypothetical protein
MVINKLLKLAEKDNCAEGLSKEKLAKISGDVVERHNKSIDSMKDWAEAVKEGKELCKPEFVGKSEPWEGSANFKSPILTEAAVNFGNRAVVELMRHKDLCKTQIIGSQSLINSINKQFSEVDEFKKQVEAIAEQAQGDQELTDQVGQLQSVIADKESKAKEKRTKLKEQRASADRIEVMMNYEINHGIDGWRTEQERLLYLLPLYGTVFKKSFYDSSSGSVCSHLITYPNFSIDQSTRDIDCAVFTNIVKVSKNRKVELERSGAWLKTEIVYSEDFEEETFLEQYCYIDLDGDDYEEPYIVTVHENTGKVVRIVARYDLDSIYVKQKDIKTMQLNKAVKERAKKIINDKQAVGAEVTQDDIPDAEDFTGFTLVKIEPTKVLTKYGFVTDVVEGHYLDVGYYYLLGMLTQGVNKTTNELLNAGSLATLQGGFTSKGFRKAKGQIRAKPGYYQETDIPIGQLGGSMMPYQFKEPSQTLYALNEKMEQTARAFGFSIDAAAQLTSNTAPTTALAMIQESLVNLSAHHLKIVRSMTRELEIIYDLKKNTIDVDDYKKITGDSDAITESDFAIDGMLIVPTADPEQSSRMQRIMLANAEMEQIPLVMQAGGNPIPIVKNYYERIGSDNVHEIFPNEAELSPADKQARDQMIKQQQLQIELQEQQKKLTELQTQLLMRDQDRKDAEFAEGKDKRDAEVKKIVAQTVEILTSTKLDVTNAVNDQLNRLEDLNEKDREYESAREVESRAGAGDQPESD